MGDIEIWRQLTLAQVPVGLDIKASSGSPFMDGNETEDIVSQNL